MGLTQNTDDGEQGHLTWISFSSPENFWLNKASLEPEEQSEELQTTQRFLTKLESGSDINISEVNSVFRNLRTASRGILIEGLCSLHDHALKSNIDEIASQALIDQLVEIILGSESVEISLIASGCMVVIMRKKYSNQSQLYRLLEWIGKLLGSETLNIETMTFCFKLIEYLMEDDVLAEQCRVFPNFLKIFAHWLEDGRLVVQYHVLLLFWMASFSGTFLISDYLELNIAGSLLEICKSNQKEKIIRLSAAIWRNLYSLSEKAFAPIFIGLGLVDFIESIQPSVTDEEALTDLSYIKARLNDTILSMSSFEEYEAELRSGCLDWSPPHKSDLFWIDNAYRFLESDGELLNFLFSLLEVSRFGSKVTSIAIHDLGMILKHVPSAPMAFERCNGKFLLMNLISCSDADVRFQALNTMQLLMKKTWNTNV